MNQKEIVDQLLAMMEINKSKRTVLTEMCKLEQASKENTKEYQELINTYELVYSVYKKKLASNSKEQSKLLETILELNNNKINNIFSSIESCLKNDHAMAQIKTLTDLGIPIMRLYSEDKQITNIFSFLFPGFNSEEDTKVKDASLINEYMIRDYFSSLLNVVESEIKEPTTNNQIKKELIELKYKLIFISSDLEYRAILTKFQLPNTPKLVDNFNIMIANIDPDDYTNQLDGILIAEADKKFQRFVQEIYMGRELTLFSKIDFRAHLRLLKDKGLCSLLLENFPIDLDCSMKQAEKLKELDDIITEESKQKSNTKYRKHPSI